MKKMITINVKGIYIYYKEWYRQSISYMIQSIQLKRLLKGKNTL